MMPRRTRLEPPPPTVPEQLAGLARMTRQFFVVRRDLSMPAEIAALLPVLDRAAADSGMEQATILEICASFIAKCAACEDVGVATILDAVDAMRGNAPKQAWTLHDLDVLAKWSDQP